jgi:Zn-dependent metalloprotease
MGIFGRATDLARSRCLAGAIALIAAVAASGFGGNGLAAPASAVPITEQGPSERSQIITDAPKDPGNARQERGAFPPVKGDPPTFSKEYRDYLAYQVAEDAKTQLVSWAKWIIGVVALMIAILGIKTYFDVQSKINSTIDKELTSAKQRTDAVINDFTKEKDVALMKLQAETERASQLISEQTIHISEQSTQASARIALIVGGLPGYIAPSAISGLSRLIYDAEHKAKLPGKLVRKEGDPPSSDSTVNEVFDNIGLSYNFLVSVFGPQMAPADGKVAATVHYQRKYNNGFWNGEQLVLGDGDGEIFSKFSGLDIIAGELSYSLINAKTKLEYHGAQGALITHLRDVFSVMTVQWHEKQKADSASWLIGADSFSAKLNASGIRSMKSPGTAYDNPTIGKDPQPAHMKDYVTTDEDNGGVHVNSGIPNRAFYLCAIGIGGFSWERAGVIWVKSLERVTASTDFDDFATLTYDTAKKIYGYESNEAKIVAKSWAEVGISVHVRQARSSPRKGAARPARVQKPDVAAERAK